MYLKKIEVQGFKSFANKIIFDFHNGITGIVGPNGSGKSNVADAVRWVLGEQSAKQLRGGNMQDVIFSGTQIRKPQGYAYVAITLDNSDRSLDIDFEEVTVSRRIYRSGESEYKINGSSVRLKDISELFYDTGIGKDGYSIIGQGQVEKILNGKPEERRELLDEAAGITKYKRRKYIALKKLENEEAGLTRVADILSELEKQIGPLEKQAKIAKEYMKLKDELKSLDAGMFIIQSNLYSDEIKELEKKEKIVSDDLTVTKETEEKLKSEYEEAELNIRNIEEKINEQREINENKNILLSELSGRIELIKEQIKTENYNKEHINTRVAEIKRELNKKNIEQSELQKKYDDINSILDADLKYKADLVLKSEEINSKLADISENLHKSRQESFDNINKRGEWLAELKSIEASISQIKIRKSELSSRLVKLSSDKENILKNIENSKNEKESLSLKLSKLEENKNEKIALKNELDKEIALNSNILADISNKYQICSAKLDTLKNIAEKYEGYGNSIKKVMETRDRVKGIHGVIADLLTIDKNYELAIETALGARIQNIITDTEETAKSLVEYLKKNKYGRATFLPLSSISSSNTYKNHRVMSEKGIINIASELIKSDDTYRALIENLLGRILVVDTIDNAIAIERKYKYEFRIVTIDGELLSPGGAISGGMYKNSSNLLGRKREIEELEKDINRYSKKSTDIEEKISNAKKAVENINAELIDLEKETRDLTITGNNIEYTLEVSLKEADTIGNELDTLLIDDNNFDNDIADKEKFYNEISSKLLEFDKQKDENIFLLEELELNQSTILSEQDNTNKLLAEVDIKISNSKQSIEFINDNITRLIDESNSLIEEERTISTGIGNFEFNISAKENEIKIKSEEIDKLRQSISKAKNELNAQLEIKKEEDKNRKLIFENLNELSKRILDLDKELYRLNSSHTNIEEKIENLSSYMWNEYELSYDKALNLDRPDISLSEFKKEISRVKNNIKMLGHVNVNSIEDYNEVSSRYEEMKIQYDDIMFAKEELVTIISELETKMTNKFTEKFAKISEQFDLVFKELFGGGSAKLVLSKDMDILEADISIISEPPGKKLQNMMQLSGGEKALTAISLLFAIQNLKPSPFALLDEIEAALDDSNVDRFANYLHKLSKATQFIVITHRRGTMVSADRLYGITMQEKGVSTLVSVNLIEDKLDA